MAERVLYFRIDVEFSRPAILSGNGASDLRSLSDFVVNVAGRYDVEMAILVSSVRAVGRFETAILKMVTRAAASVVNPSAMLEIIPATDMRKDILNREIPVERQGNIAPTEIFCALRPIPTIGTTPYIFVCFYNHEKPIAIIFRNDEMKR